MCVKLHFHLLNIFADSYLGSKHIHNIEKNFRKIQNLDIIYKINYFEPIIEYTKVPNQGFLSRPNSILGMDSRTSLENPDIWYGFWSE